MAQLTSQTNTYNYTLTTTNDNILEDDEESFSISITLQNSGLLVEVHNSSVTIIIKDNEG